MVDDAGRYAGTVSIADIRPTATWLPTSLPGTHRHSHRPLRRRRQGRLSGSSPAAPAIWWCWARRNRWRASSPRPAWPLPWRNSSGGDGMGEFLARNAEALIRSIGVHLFYTLVSVVIGFVLGLGLGILLSRFPRQARFILPLLSCSTPSPAWSLSACCSWCSTSSPPPSSSPCPSMPCSWC